MLTWTARGALNVTNSATGQENALPPGIAHEVLIAEPHSPQDTHTAPTDPVTEPTLNPVQSSNVFDEEVTDIAQVHCDSELFEFELSTSPPFVNVKGNLRRNFEFWNFRSYFACLFCPGQRRSVWYLSIMLPADIGS